jgi:diadenosine tetraphosphate (Ap4A) HIT family hydrolase
MTFELHPNLAKKIFVKDFPLCRLLLEDEKHYPWFFLIPRRPNISRLIDLSAEDQLQLMKEMDTVQNIVWKEFHPTQLNVAAIGNKTPQLHVHIIARYENDPAWPHTVWDHPVRQRCDEELIKLRISPF